MTLTQGRCRYDPILTLTLTLGRPAFLATLDEETEVLHGALIHQVIHM